MQGLRTVILFLEIDILSMSLGATTFKIPGYSMPEYSLFELFEKNITGQEYANHFFPKINKAEKPDFRTFHTQIDLPNRKSYFAFKHPELYDKIVSMKVDFPVLLQTDNVTCPLYHHIEEEDKIREKVLNYVKSVF